MGEARKEAERYCSKRYTPGTTQFLDCVIAYLFDEVQAGGGFISVGGRLKPKPQAYKRKPKPPKPEEPEEPRPAPLRPMPEPGRTEDVIVPEEQESDWPG